MSGISGMEWWNGMLEWNGGMEHWNGIAKWFFLQNNVTQLGLEYCRVNYKYLIVKNFCRHEILKF